MSVWFKIISTIFAIAIAIGIQFHYIMQGFEGFASPWDFVWKH